MRGKRLDRCRPAGWPAVLLAAAWLATAPGAILAEPALQEAPAQTESPLATPTEGSLPTPTPDIVTVEEVIPATSPAPRGDKSGLARVAVILAGVTASAAFITWRQR